MGLITESYKAQMRQMHVEKSTFGTSGHMRAGDVLHLAVRHNAKTILDYGSGKGTLKHNLTLPVREYDPGIPGKDSEPSPADLVVASDVLEHIEPECLDSVLAHLVSLTNKVCYVVVHLTPAQKHLPDGRNAHLIIENEDWWEGKLSGYFKVDKKVWNTKEAAFVLKPNAIS